MAKPKPYSLSSSPLLFFSITLISLHPTTQLQYYELQSLLKIQQLFNYPPSLNVFYTSTNFCNIDPTDSFKLACYGENLTQLHIDGQFGNFTLPDGFSTETLFSTLSSFSSLKVLSLVSLNLSGQIPADIENLVSLEILNLSSNSFENVVPIEVSSLKSLQSLILDDNRFSGELPDWIGSLRSLSVLSLKKNELNGSLPGSVSSLKNLRILDFSRNNLTGDIPNLRLLRNLQLLDAQENSLGPHFPNLPRRITAVNLRKNKFGLGLPTETKSLYRLKKLDLSMNNFVGRFFPDLISLPSIEYIDIGGNKFTGMMNKNMSCGPELVFVNLSSNLLTGNLPSCLENNGRLALYAKNCLSGEKRDQHPGYFCHNEAIAVTIIPPKMKHKRRRYDRNTSASLVIGILGGVLGGIVVLGFFAFVVAKKIQGRDRDKAIPTRLLVENASSTVSNFKLLSDARYISQTMKMGSTIPNYRTFSLEELKNATNDFDGSSLIPGFSNCQMYKATLADGTTVAIRRLELKKRRSSQTYMPDIERISRLRHENLLSALGHCFESHPNESNVIKIYVVFEFAVNGTLRDHISGNGRKKITWVPRIASAIELVKGIRFLHTGIVPGVYSNDVKITDVMMDHSLHVKISKFNLPLLADDGKLGSRGANGTKRDVHSRVQYEDRNDVYDIGVILLELIVGRAVIYPNEVILLKDLIQVSLAADNAARRSIVDALVHKECSDESLKTMMEICIRCLDNEQMNRPSVEDVLWNLQFAIQVQESPNRESHNFQQEIMSENRETFVDVPL